MVQRILYLEKLKTLKDKNIIKVLTGIRRCGKSTMLEQFMEELKKMGIPESNIIHMNLEDPKYQFENYMDFYDFIHKKITTNEQYYIFLDEVQNVKDFQKAVDGLYIKKNVDLYITVSNAYLLSGELATLLSGRYIEIRMLPLSFKEFSSFGDTQNLQKKFLEYMEIGGMPGNLEFLPLQKNATSETN